MEYLANHERYSATRFALAILLLFSCQCRHTGKAVHVLPAVSHHSTYCWRRRRAERSGAIGKRVWKKKKGKLANSALFKVNNNNIMINQRKMIVNDQKKKREESCILLHKTTKQASYMLRGSGRPSLAQYARITWKIKTRLSGPRQVRSALSVRPLRRPAPLHPPSKARRTTRSTTRSDCAEQKRPAVVSETTRKGGVKTEESLRGVSLFLQMSDFFFFSLRKYEETK